MLQAAWHFGQTGDLSEAAEVLAGQARTLVRRGQALPAADVAWALLTRASRRPDLARQVAEALDLCRRSAADLTSADAHLLPQLAASESRAHLMLSQSDDAVRAGNRATALAGRLRTVVPKEAAEVRARALATGHCGWPRRGC